MVVIKTVVHDVDFLANVNASVLKDSLSLLPEIALFLHLVVQILDGLFVYALASDDFGDLSRYKIEELHTCRSQNALRLVRRNLLS